MLIVWLSSQSVLHLVIYIVMKKNTMIKIHLRIFDLKVTARTGVWC